MVQSLNAPRADAASSLTRGCCDQRRKDRPRRIPLALVTCDRRQSTVCGASSTNGMQTGWQRSGDMQRLVSRMEATLRSIATELDASAIAYYKTGRTLQIVDQSPVLDDPNWTGLIYLVAAWADVPDARRTGGIEGFVPGLQCRGQPALLETLGNQSETGLIARREVLPPNLKSSAVLAANAISAVLVNLSLHERTPDVVILYFGSDKAALRIDRFAGKGQRDWIEVGGIRQLCRRPMPRLGTACAADVAGGPASRIRTPTFPRS